MTTSMEMTRMSDMTDKGTKKIEQSNTLEKTGGRRHQQRPNCLLIDYGNDSHNSDKNDIDDRYK